MIRTAEGFLPTDGKIEGALDKPSGWSRLPWKATSRMLSLFLGSKEAGPALYLMISSPVDAVEGEPRVAPGAPVHLHRSPSFRLMLGTQAEQQLVDGEWLGPRDYFVLDANK